MPRSLSVPGAQAKVAHSFHEACMTCLGDRWPSIMFSCDGWDKFDDDFGEIPI